jgi:hypothetical protein
MLLGQLFYLEKQIRDLPDRPRVEDLLNLDILGLENLQRGELTDLTVENLAQVLKDKFGQRFGSVLADNGLVEASQFWISLTSPLNLTSQTDQTKIEHGIQAWSNSTEFKQSLSEWATAGFPLNQIPDLISLGAMTTTDEEFALYYGLLVMQKLTLIDRDLAITQVDWTLHLVDKIDQPIDQPQILVVGFGDLKPLFKNLNILVLEPKINWKESVDEIGEIVTQNPQIELVLVDESMVDIYNHLLRSIGEKLLVANLNFDQTTGDSFFQKIVKQTLGVRLT